MPDALFRPETASIQKSAGARRRTVLSLFIAATCSTAAPAWADCVNEGGNENGGVNITCDGEDIRVDPQMLGGSLSNNNITVQGDGVTVNGTDLIYGGYGELGIFSDDTSATVTRNSVTLNGSVIKGTVYGGYALMNPLMIFIKIIKLR